MIYLTEFIHFFYTYVMKRRLAWIFIFQKQTSDMKDFYYPQWILKQNNDDKISLCESS